jgi:hypothetical protein
MNCGQEGDIYVDVTHDCSVGGLKEAIAAQCNISTTQQRLLFMGRELDDDASLLSDHGELLSNYSTLHMTHRPSLNRSHDFSEEADGSLTEPGLREDAETIPSIVETLLQMLHTMTSGGMAIGGGAPGSVHSIGGGYTTRASFSLPAMAHRRNLSNSTRASNATSSGLARAVHVTIFSTHVPLNASSSAWARYLFSRLSNLI